MNSRPRECDRCDAFPGAGTLSNYRIGRIGGLKPGARSALMKSLSGAGKADRSACAVTTGNCAPASPGWWQAWQSPHVAQPLSWPQADALSCEPAFSTDRPQPVVEAAAATVTDARQPSACCSPAACAVIDPPTRMNGAVAMKSRMRSSNRRMGKSVHLKPRQALSRQRAV